MSSEERKDDDVHISLAVVIGRVRAAKFITRSGETEVVEFTEEEQQGSESGKPSEAQQVKIDAIVARLKSGQSTH